MLVRNVVSFLGLRQLQLDMSYVSCLAEREYVTRLSTLVVLLTGVDDFSNSVHDLTLLSWPDNVLAFLASFRR